MKKILVIYFTQTGQAKKAVDAVLKPISENNSYEIHYELIKPKVPIKFPWKFMEFMDAFPENVQGVPFELEPLNTDVKTNYDLVIVSYQPWFLSICRPIASFLQSTEAKQLLENKPVITIINCRNMWLGAQESMKKRLLDLHANLVGNIVFADPSGNLTSLVTVLAFELKGVKEKFMGFFPRYGVNDDDLAKAEVLGKYIKEAMDKNNFSDLQPKIVEQGFVKVVPNLMIMEGRGRALFPLYANYITKKGSAGSKERRTRVKIFGIVLPTGILLLSPFITIMARLVPVLAAGKMKKLIAYYQQNSLEKQ